MKMNYLLKWLGIVAIIFLWWLLCRIGFLDSFFVPSPVFVIKSLFEHREQGLIIHTLATLSRVLVAFVLSIIIGVVAGILLGSNKVIYQCVEIPIEMLRSIPAIALFPLAMLLWGVGSVPKIVVAVIAGSTILIVATIHGMRHVRASHITSAQMMGANKLQIIKTVIFYECLQHIILGMRTAWSFCLVVIVATELFAGTNAGLGRVIIDAQMTYELPTMYAAIIIIGIVGYLGNVILMMIYKKVVHWETV
jgi:NitT/TauT family transport system permease protein